MWWVFAKRALQIALLLLLIDTGQAVLAQDRLELRSKQQGGERGNRRAGPQVAPDPSARPVSDEEAPLPEDNAYDFGEVKIELKDEKMRLFVEGKNYQFEPAVFPGKNFQGKPRGPKEAKGLVIWNAGLAETDLVALRQVPPIVQYFAEQGWDAYNLRRHTVMDTAPKMLDNHHNLINLIRGILRRVDGMGYRNIVLMGQARGAYGVVMAGRYKLEADVTGILALGPMPFGPVGKSGQWRQNDFAVRSFFDKYDGRVAVAAGYFNKDATYEIELPNVRGPYAEKKLTELNVPNFIINHPSYDGMEGNAAGRTWQFANRYGACLEKFYLTRKRPPCEESDPASAATFGIEVPAFERASDPMIGQWQGTWSNGRFAVLTLTMEQAGEYGGMYQVGAAANGLEAQNERTYLRPTTKDTYEWAYSEKARLRFTRQPDGTLAGEAQEEGSAAEGAKGIFIKARPRS